MFHFAVARQFHQVDVADQVGLDIGVRVFNRVAHPGLRPQMHDPVNPCAFDGGVQRGHVGKVEVVEGEAVAPGGGQRRDPVALQ